MRHRKTIVGVFHAFGSYLAELAAEVISDAIVELLDRSDSLQRLVALKSYRRDVRNLREQWPHLINAREFEFSLPMLGKPGVQRCADPLCNLCESRVAPEVN